MPNASLLVPGARSPEDPGMPSVIKSFTAPQAHIDSVQGALYLFKLPAIGHGGHHLRELLLLTLKHTVHVLHRHLREQGPQVRQAPHNLLLPPQPSKPAPGVDSRDSPTGVLMRLMFPSTSRTQVIMPKAPNASTKTKQTGWNSCHFLLPHPPPKIFLFLNSKIN